MHRNNSSFFILACFLLIALLVACGPPVPAPPGGGGAGGGESEPTDTPEVPYPAATDTQPAEAGYPEPGSEPTDEPYPAPEVPTVEATLPGVPGGGSQSGDDVCLPADPQRIEFMAEDGTELVGTYYPPFTCGVPVVILMHQFGEDRSIWADLARWMQNRSEGSAAAFKGLAAPVAQYCWFPPMPENLTFAVFTFDFRGHGESAAGEGSGIDPAGFLMDARAALDTAKGLSGVDPNRVITGGGSIGADAAADSCIVLDGFLVAENQSSQNCIGVISFSPGDFLGVSYPDVVETLMNHPHDPVVYCLAAEADGVSPQACNSAGGDDYTATIYPGTDHAIALLSPDRSPDIGELILDFLMESLAKGG